MKVKAHFATKAAAVAKSIIDKTVSPLALLLALAGSAVAAPSRPGVEFCADVRDAVTKDDALRGAIAAAFGDARFQSENVAGRDDASPCERSAALLHFDRADVLVTTHASRGRAGHSDSAWLSAYILRKSNGAFRLVTASRDFAEGNAGWGNAGDITQARFGEDDGLIVSGSQTAQGYSDGTASLYAFRSGVIVPLGTIPIEWDNGGAEEDDDKVVTITARIDSDQPEPDRVRVVYTRKEAGASRTQETVWRSDNEKLVLESGSLPKEIAALNIRNARSVRGH